MLLKLTRHGDQGKGFDPFIWINTEHIVHVLLAKTYDRINRGYEAVWHTRISCVTDGESCWTEVIESPEYIAQFFPEPRDAFSR